MATRLPSPRWCTTGEDGLQPLYGIAFEATLEEHDVPALAGYRGMGPVRRGNLAWVQKQHDVYGSVVLAATQLFFDQRLVRPGDEEAFHRLEPLGDRAWALHDQPDAGIWEFRGRAEVHTYSSVMCWAACDRLARIAAHLGLAPRAAFWRGRADTMRANILERAWDAELGHFVESAEGRRLDASLLLLACASQIELSMANMDMAALGRVSPLSIMIFALTAGYGLVAAWSAVDLFRRRKASAGWAYAFGVVLCGLHLAMVVHLARHGMIGLRTWVA